MEVPNTRKVLKLRVASTGDARKSASIFAGKFS